MSQTALNAESQLVHPESVLVPQNKDERGTGLDLESLDNDALKKQLLKGYSAGERSLHTASQSEGPESIYRQNLAPKSTSSMRLLRARRRARKPSTPTPQ
jgi:hypothetical protein